MNKTLTAEPTAEEAAKMDAEFRSLFAAMERIDERIKKDQQEIDRLTVKTRIMLDQLKAQ